MGSEQWQQIAELVDSALDIEPVERAGFLDKACAGNESLRQEVESLLARADSPFLEAPALELLLTSFGVVGPDAELQSFAEGSQIGPYRITAFLGAGGMGEVYRATDTRLGREVALKFLPARLSKDPQALERFQREARSESALNHPNICTLYDVGEHEGQPYLVMELLEGESLKQRLERGPLSPPEVVELGVAVSEALEAAHVRGIVHRDIKPGNIFLTPRGRAKVLDFGIAKLLAEPAPGPAAEAGSVPLPAWETTGTERGRAVGTVAYMSPEQARGEEVDPRSDLFSLGITLYEAATGRQPFRKETPQATLEAILSPAPAPPRAVNQAVPRRLEPVLLKSLEKDRERRYQSAAELKAALDRAGQSPWRSPAVRWTAIAGILAVAMLIATLGPIWLREAAPGQRIRSVAVLPLADLSGESEQHYFADAMTATLIADLSKVSALKVISHRSMAKYKGTSKPLRDIARELNVDTIVEGSVVRDADRVRVTAQLTDVASGRNLWANTYEREMRGILALQGEVARAIAREVRVRLTSAEETRLAGKRQVNPAAYEAYLRGMYHVSQGTEEGNRKGTAYLVEAAQRNPAEPLAQARLALGYAHLALGAAPPEDILPRAREAVRTALEMDDALPEAVTASAVLKGYRDWNWDGAVRDCERALELDPNMVLAHYHLAWFYAVLGRMKEAIQHHLLAKELDPLNPQFAAFLGELYRMEGQYQEAVNHVQRALDVNPKYPLAHWILGLIYEDQGKYGEAIAEMQKAGEAGQLWQWAVGATYAVAGRRDEARKVLAELSRQEITPWNAYWLACIHGALGDKDEAFRWLNYEPHHSWIPYLVTKDPVCCGARLYMKPLRSDPRFRQVQLRTRVPL